MKPDFVLVEKKRKRSETMIEKVKKRIKICYFLLAVLWHRLLRINCTFFHILETANKMLGRSIKDVVNACDSMLR